MPSMVAMTRTDLPVNLPRAMVKEVDRWIDNGWTVAKSRDEFLRHAVDHWMKCPRGGRCNWGDQEEQP
ncbi:MAG: hypothetical protein ABR562_05745 [Thermoplasmatota archaeon]